MMPYEVIPCIEHGGLMRLSMYSQTPIERKVADALIQLSATPSSDWTAAQKLRVERAVGVELSLEQLSMLLERVDFTSGRAEDIAAIRFWPELYAAMELLKAVGYEWSSRFGFDCHESYAVRWRVPEGMAGYLVWLARHARSVAWTSEDQVHWDAGEKLRAAADALVGALDRHVNETAGRSSPG